MSTQSPLPRSLWGGSSVGEGLLTPPTSLASRAFKLSHKLSKLSVTALGSHGTCWVLGLS